MNKLVKYSCLAVNNNYFYQMLELTIERNTKNYPAFGGDIVVTPFIQAGYCLLRRALKEKINI